jgi:hypothetical protein
VSTLLPKRTATTEISEGLFSGCTSLQTITIPDSIVTISEKAFEGCTSLTSITLPGNLSYLGNYALKDCSALQSLAIPSTIVEIGTGLCYQCSALSSVDLGTGVFVINNEAFAKTNLVNIILPENLTYIGVINYIDSSDEVIGAFEETSISSVDFPDSLKTIGVNSFKSCTDLASVGFGAGLTTIADKAFMNAKKLTSIEIGNAIRLIGDSAFEGCSLVSEMFLTYHGTGSLKIRDSAFKDLSALESLTITVDDRIEVYEKAFEGTDSLEFLEVSAISAKFDDFWKADTSVLKPIVFAKIITSVEGLDHVRCADNECGCAPGYGNEEENGIDSYVFSCYPCPAGHVGAALTQDACVKCVGGKYASGDVGATECTSCEPGKFSKAEGAVSADVCTPCEKGKFSTQGSTKCIDCPPGSECPSVGATWYQKCSPGHFTNSSLQTTCHQCAPGTYQEKLGQAVCSPCPAGTYNSESGSTSISMCLDCQPGTYSAQRGSEYCFDCSVGYVASDSGQTVCLRCKDTDDLSTSNALNTHCVEDEDLKFSSATENFLDALFKKGGAMYGAFIIAAGFILVASGMQWKREKDVEVLGQLTRSQAAFKSLLPGLSFGLEMFLIAGMMVEARGLAAVIITFRLFHMIGAAVLVTCMFGPGRFAESMETVIKDAPLLRDELDKEPFCRDNMPMICVIILLSSCDMTMFQFLPWRSSKFFTESKGFPSMQILKLCLLVKSVQSTVSAICQISFLVKYTDIRDATTGPLAKVMFSFNIILSVVTVLAGGLLLVLKYDLLDNVDQNLAKKLREAHQIHMQDDSVVGIEMNMGSVYPSDQSDQASSAPDAGPQKGNSDLPQAVFRRVSVSMAPTSDNKPKSMMIENPLHGNGGGGLGSINEYSEESEVDGESGAAEESASTAELATLRKQLEAKDYEITRLAWEVKRLKEASKPATSSGSGSGPSDGIPSGVTESGVL